MFLSRHAALMSGSALSCRAEVALSGVTVEGIFQHQSIHKHQTAAPTVHQQLRSSAPDAIGMLEAELRQAARGM